MEIFSRMVIFTQMEIFSRMDIPMVKKCRIFSRLEPKQMIYSKMFLKRIMFNLIAYQNNLKNQIIKKPTNLKLSAIKTNKMKTKI